MPIFDLNLSGPNVIIAPSREQLEEAFTPYATELGRLVYAWNRLQERLARLFCIVCNFEDEAVGPAIWYSIPSDLSQRKMLRAAIDNSKKQVVPESADLIWLLDKVDTILAHKRNDALHAPFVLVTGTDDQSQFTKMVSDMFSDNPKAAKLHGKDLMAEFQWYANYADALSSYADSMIDHLHYPDDEPWPKKPSLPHRGQKKNRKADTPKNTRTKP